MKTAFTHGTLLDGTEDMQPQEDMTVIVEDGKITAIGKSIETSAAGCEIVFLGGRYLLPGLINLHVHIPANGKPKDKDSDPKKKVKFMTSNPVSRWFLDAICESYVLQELNSGVTTIRAVGGVLDVDSRLRDRIRAGKVKGPDILAADAAISVPGGHMAGSLAFEAHSAEAAAALVDKIAAWKPDLIKLMITGGVLDATVKGEPGVLKMPPEYVKAACDRAHAYGLPVAAHVESPEGVKVALRNGVDTIEHGARPDEEMLDLFRETGAKLVATLSPALPYALFDQAVSHASDMEQYNGQVVFDGIIDCAKACLEAGIPVGLGTDTGCPYVTHYDMWRELNYFVKYCGVTPAFALYTATLGNACIAGIGDRTGSIEVGKDADLLVLDRDPRENAMALRRPSMVMTKGKLVKEPQVKKMRDVEKELDKFI